jgi:hypothetical protein
MRLRRRERAAACAAGCALCVLAGAIAPRDAAAVVSFGRSAVVPSVTPASQVGPTPVAIARDPFVVELRSTDAPAPADAGRFSPIPGLPVLPPNDAVDPAHPKAAGLGVRAVVTGARPAAIVGVGDRTLLVRPGDVLDGKRVERIDAGGVYLTGNVRLALGP